MRTYALISQKGGAGKSTLALQLACKAAESGPAFIVDRDPQGTVRKWWERRQEGDDAPAYPELIALDGQTLTAAVAAAKSGAGSLFIDTRPAVESLEAEAARVADIAIIPVRPSIADLEAVVDTLAIIRRLDRRAVLVVNAAKAEKRATEARAALGAYGVPVAPFYIADRAVYQDAQIEGRGVGEMRGAPAVSALAEITNLWNWINEAHNV